MMFVMLFMVFVFVGCGGSGVSGREEFKIPEEGFDTTKEVEKEKLIKICDIARLAPSACNSQPWKLHIINKESKNLDAVRKACQVVGLNKFLNDVNSYIVIEQVFGNRSASLGSHFGKNDLPWEEIISL